MTSPKRLIQKRRLCRFKMPTTIENLADMQLHYHLQQDVSRSYIIKRFETTGVPEILVALISGRLEIRAIEEYSRASLQQKGRAHISG